MPLCMMFVAFRFKTPGRAQHQRRSRLALRFPMLFRLELAVQGPQQVALHVGNPCEEDDIATSPSDESFMFRARGMGCHQAVGEMLARIRPAPPVQVLRTLPCRQLHLRCIASLWIEHSLLPVTKRTLQCRLDRLDLTTQI